MVGLREFLSLRSVGRTRGPLELERFSRDGRHDPAPKLSVATLQRPAVHLYTILHPTLHILLTYDVLLHNVYVLCTSTQNIGMQVLSMCPSSVTLRFSTARFRVPLKT